MAEFDHLVIAAATLDEGEAWLAELGLPLGAGGVHEQMGTHNRLLSLGPGEYLELIAVNPKGKKPNWPRWFGLDGFEGEPRLVSWVSRMREPSQPGTHTIDLQRGDLRWRFTLPHDGQPLDQGITPALIEWQGTAHPTLNLTDHGFRLKRLALSHPAPLPVLPLRDERIRLHEGPISMRATVSSPQGDVTL